MNHSTNFDNFRKDWRKLSGKIPFRMTNDYLFRAITQESKTALRGLLSAIFHFRQEDISFLEIMNPIVLGQAIDDKEFILDVKITMNNNTIIDLELQVINYHNWPDRSLQYLRRVFNSLKQGQDYDETIPQMRILHSIRSCGLNSSNLRHGRNLVCWHRKMKVLMRRLILLSGLCLTKRSGKECLPGKTITAIRDLWSDGLKASA